MHSSFISKIAKAKRYAEEPERIQFTRFEMTFRGESDVHFLVYDNGEWSCTCRFFHDWGDCSHTMAVQRVLGVTIPASHRHGLPAGVGARIDTLPRTKERANERLTGLDKPLTTGSDKPLTRLEIDDLLHQI